MEPERDDLELDRSEVRKVARALRAYIKSTASSQKVVNEAQPIFLLFTFWRIPSNEQTIRIPLPNDLRTKSGNVCLFTRDEPNMTSDQTERFHKRLLKERGVKDVSEVILFRVLMTKYKSFEAVRRLLGSFDLFLADARILHSLPPHIETQFNERKKTPLSVDLESKHLARNIEHLIQGVNFTVSKKGSCCTAHVAHSSMTADEIMENVVTAVSTVSTNLHMKGRNIKVIHLRGQNSAALPIYTSKLSHPEEGMEKNGAQKRKRENETTEGLTEEREEDEDSEDEEFPQFEPIEMAIGRRNRDLAKKETTKVPKSADGKRLRKPRKDKNMGKKTQKFTARGLKSKPRDRRRK